MEKNTKCSLFASTFNGMGKWTNENDHEDWEDLFEDVELVDLSANVLVEKLEIFLMNYSTFISSL